MSNRRRLPGSRVTVHCAVCGRGTGKLARQVRLRDSRIVCGGCVDRGALVRKLSCGHVVTAGNLVVRQSGGTSEFACYRCAADTFDAGVRTP